MNQIPELKKHLNYFLFSLLGTVLVMRVYLFFFPLTNLYIGPYNIHHLFVGALLLVICTIFFIMNIVNLSLIFIAGVSSGFILDQFVYLIATNGSDQSYWMPISVWGVIISILLMMILAGGVYCGHQQRKEEKMRK